MFLFYFFLILISIGFPIALAMGIVPFAYVLITGEFPMKVLPYKMFEVLENFSLIAIPLFLLGGSLVTRIGLTEKLVNFSNELVGRMTGGLSHVNVLVSTIFGGLNGSAVADTAAVGSILIKPMIKMGFSRAYTAAVTACGATISAIIPPSIPFILFCTSVPNISIGALFISGIIPGILICFFMCLAGYFISKRRNYPKLETPFALKKLWVSTIDVLPALLLVGIVVGGLRSGVFTPTEAASVIVVFCLFWGFLVYRNLNFSILVDALVETTLIIGTIFLIIGCAGPFMWVLTRIGANDTISFALAGVSASPVIWWTVAIVIMLVAGMIMDTVANILILSPFFFEAAVAQGTDPLVSAFAISVVFLIGTVTPPVAISIYVAAAIAEEKIEKIGMEIIPFVIAELAVVALALIFPELVKFLPRAFGYKV